MNKNKILINANLAFNMNAFRDLVNMISINAIRRIKKKWLLLYKLINEIETPQKTKYSSPSQQLTINPTQAIVGGIAMLPGMLLEAFTSANEEAKRKLSLNQDVALIDTILAALALLR